MWRLVGALVSLAVLVVGLFAGWLGYSYTTADLDTRGEVAFDRPLAIPPLAPSTVDAGGRRVFDLTLQKGRSDLGGDRPTATMGINGPYLGPTLRPARTSWSTKAPAGRRHGGSTSRPRRSGTTRTCTAAPPSRSTRDWPACSSSTIRRPTSRCRRTTASTTSR